MDLFGTVAKTLPPAAVCVHELLFSSSLLRPAAWKTALSTLAQEVKVGAAATERKGSESLLTIAPDLSAYSDTSLLFKRIIF